MKQLKFVMILMALSITFTSKSQSMNKKFITLKVSRKIEAPASKVWGIMVLDYGHISNFSPYIYASDYENGSVEGKVGAERKCNLSEDGKMWAHEQIAEINYEKMTMKNIILDAQKMPLDLDNSYAIYSVKDNGDETATASYEFNFRTKPSIMGPIAKSSFKKTLIGTLIGLAHYVETGEKVTPTSGNYKTLVRKHKKAGTFKSNV